MADRKTAALTTIALAIVAWLVIAALLPPEDHYLKRSPNCETVKIADFEATYFGYLAGLTIPTIGAILGMLVLSHKDGKWRGVALTGMYSFSTAIALVTVGYAIRVFWRGNQTGLWESVVGIDKWFNGPFTAAAYICGFVCLVILGFLGVPRQAELIVPLKRILGVHFEGER